MSLYITDQQTLSALIHSCVLQLVLAKRLARAKLHVKESRSAFLGSSRSSSKSLGECNNELHHPLRIWAIFETKGMRKPGEE